MVYYYVIHLIKSTRLHGIHSPFVFDLYNRVIIHTGSFSIFPAIEKIRQSLYKNNKQVLITDFGAGSRTQNTRTKTISHIARTTANPPRRAQLLFRLVNFQQPVTILEIGTSLGLTTSYLAAAKKKAQVFTLEGCSPLAQQAELVFKKLQLKNVEVITGNFDETLPIVLAGLNTVDFVLFDGNHRYEPTLRYFEWCLTKSTENSVFVFDDIYWSKEMQQAWKQICKHPEVMISIDLFYLGFIFFRKNQPKQHFTIRV
ncbi:class I SAM-dependent methyltransferase [Adhaeribacter radiodurans]|uniref:Class I SAM-dependent methyltransferase n=1 Tax=Adhaeribacter radiodurans TaxID=2745197 RepID=A0A7L7LG41_9BACT|nr:class I SAM-dependent methyltransferase [Adhaeribacter radiodurans]